MTSSPHPRSACCLLFLLLLVPVTDQYWQRTYIAEVVVVGYLLKPIISSFLKPLHRPWCHPLSDTSMKHMARKISFSVEDEFLTFPSLGDFIMTILNISTIIHPSWSRKLSTSELCITLRWIKSSEIRIYLFILYLSQKIELLMEVYALLYKFEEFSMPDESNITLP